MKPVVTLALFSSISLFSSLAMATKTSLPSYSEQVSAKLAYAELTYSELDAVKAAADRYTPLSLSEQREYMGTIFKSGDRYGYTVTAGNVGANQINISVPTTEWGDVVAFWHTHFNEGPLNQYFSDLDTRTVKQFGKPFYLADYTGELKVFRSGDKLLPVLAAERIGLPAVRGFAEGDLVRDETDQLVKINTGCEQEYF